MVFVSQFNQGKLYCGSCHKYYDESECELYESKVQKWHICPSCPQKYKMRRKARNLNCKKKKDPIWLASRKF